jgi:hypothetical protein
VENHLPELRELANQLDRLVPREGAKLRLPSDPDGSTTAGTQRGYLRLAIELLRAGLQPLERGDEHDVPHIPLDIDYLLTPDSTSPFDLCEVVDDVERLPPRVQKLHPLGQLIAALLAVAVVGLIIVGAAAILSWLFH